MDKTNHQHGDAAFELPPAVSSGSTSRSPKRVRGFFSKMKWWRSNHHADKKDLQQRQRLVVQESVAEEQSVEHPQASEAVLFHDGHGIPGHLSLKVATLFLVFQPHDPAQMPKNVQPYIDVLSVQDVRYGFQACASEKFAGNLKELQAEDCGLIVFHGSKFVPQSTSFKLPNEETAQSWHMRLHEFVEARTHLLVNPEGDIVPSRLDEHTLPTLLHRLWLHARSKVDARLRDQSNAVLSPAVITTLAKGLGLELTASQVSDVIRDAITALSRASAGGGHQSSNESSRRESEDKRRPVSMFPLSKSMDSTSSVSSACSSTTAAAATHSSNQNTTDAANTAHAAGSNDHPDNGGVGGAAVDSNDCHNSHAHDDEEDWTAEDGLFAVYTALLMQHSDWVFEDDIFRRHVTNKITGRKLPGRSSPLGDDAESSDCFQKQAGCGVTPFDLYTFTLESLSNFLHDVQNESLTRTEAVIAHVLDPLRDVMRSRRPSAISRGSVSSLLFASTPGSRTSLFSAPPIGAPAHAFAFDVATTSSSSRSTARHSTISTAGETTRNNSAVRRRGGQRKRSDSENGEDHDAVGDLGAVGSRRQSRLRRSATWASPPSSHASSTTDMLGDSVRTNTTTETSAALSAAADDDEPSVTGAPLLEAKEEAAAPASKHHHQHQQTDGAAQQATVGDGVDGANEGDADDDNDTAAVMAAAVSARGRRSHNTKTPSATASASSTKRGSAASTTGAAQLRKKKSSKPATQASSSSSPSSSSSSPSPSSSASKPGSKPASKRASGSAAASSRRTASAAGSKTRSQQQPRGHAPSSLSTSTASAQLRSPKKKAGARPVSAVAKSTRKSAGKPTTPRPASSKLSTGSKRPSGTATAAAAAAHKSSGATMARAAENGSGKAKKHATKSSEPAATTTPSNTRPKRTKAKGAVVANKTAAGQQGDHAINSNTKSKGADAALAPAKERRSKALRKQDPVEEEDGRAETEANQQDTTQQSQPQRHQQQRSQEQEQPQPHEHAGDKDADAMRAEEADELTAIAAVPRRRSKRISQLKSLMSNNPDTCVHVSVVLDYLHSKANCLIHPSFLSVHEPSMDAPLTHYFISSSHNTYLTGWQYLGESSVEAYVRCLRDGCKCIELDLWDGPNGFPIITHGGARCTVIDTKEVLLAIRDNAWAVSDFPLVLSLENHLCVQQQDLLADMLVEVFGSELLSEPLPNFPTEALPKLPSPNDLKRKILIKGKSIMTGEEEDREELGDTLLSGLLDIQSSDDADGCATGDWTRCVVILTQKRLVYAAPMKIVANIEEEEACLRAEFREYLASKDSWPVDSKPGELLLSDLVDVSAMQISSKKKKKGCDDGPRFVFTLSFNSSNEDHSRVHVHIGAMSDKDRQEWVEALQQRIAAQFATSTDSTSAPTTTRTPSKKMSQKLSALVHYTQAVRFHGFDHPNAAATAAFMSSFSEKKLNRLIHKSSDKLYTFTQQRLTRVYPAYHRFKSANYDPQVYWNFGCQLVALNWQTPCEEMWLHKHFFNRNGNSGYVPKPAYMLQDGFDPYSERGLQSFVENNDPISLRVRVLEARHLPLSAKVSSSIMCTVSLSAGPLDCVTAQEATYDGKNMLNPSFNIQLKCDEIYMPELATLLIKIGTKKTVIAQTGCPVIAMRPGCRSLQLFDEYNVDIPMGSVLVMVEMTRNDEPWWPIVQELSHIGRRRAIRSKDRSVSPKREQGDVGVHAADEEEALDAAEGGEPGAASRKVSLVTSEGPGATATTATAAVDDADAEKKKAEWRQRRLQSRKARLASIQSKVKQYIQERVTTSDLEAECGRQQKHPRFVGLNGETSIDVSNITSRVADYISKPLDKERRNPDAGFKKQHPRFVGLSASTPAPAKTSSSSGGSSGHASSTKKKPTSTPSPHRTKAAPSAVSAPASVHGAPKKKPGTTTASSAKQKQRHQLTGKPRPASAKSASAASTESTNTGHACGPKQAKGATTAARSPSRAVKAQRSASNKGSAEAKTLKLPKTANQANQAKQARAAATNGAVQTTSSAKTPSKATHTAAGSKARTPSKPRAATTPAPSKQRTRQHASGKKQDGLSGAKVNKTKDNGKDGMSTAHVKNVRREAPGLSVHRTQLPASTKRSHDATAGGDDDAWSGDVDPLTETDV
ncbi:hypothetical protein PTSG_01932 [Salpingoeca rosetta]|uniref:Phosphoinositide phospholipase C n=1 Tax=Salpingoeca rosetta (strain ATCC 50818 / BSB-021) TaxID=946362 RepID=F2TZD4_SALR5|nr:uncharacterized protein PTSG_01932 [Salpingoeca rosetta]EGD78958.1 hypothetical protein PTSG_01932 [Salpingoeca rosetta]|eukprot:XP_004997914.1 hypothetical protein PTSG_01932 [Salpingoeca rosetta]